MIADQETFWRAIVLFENGSQNLVLISEVLGRRSPKEVHRFLFASLSLFRLIQSAKEKCVETHLSEKPGIGIGVPESVDVPTNSWCDPESLLDELVSEHHVIDYVIEMRSCLIIIDPTTIYKFQLSFLDELLDYLLSFVALSIPPHLEVTGGGLRKFSLWILLQFFNDTVECKSDTCQLLFHVGTRVILIDCLVPTHIIMRVGNTMYYQLFVLIFSPWWWCTDLLLSSLSLQLELIHFFLHSLLVLVGENFLWFLFLMHFHFHNTLSHHLMFLHRRQFLKVRLSQLL